METKKLYNTRILPALDEMYELSENIFGLHEKLGYTKILRYCRKDKNGRMELPFEAFLLEESKQKEITAKATKGLRQWWRFPYRTEMTYSDDEIKNMKERLKTLSPDDFEYDILKNKIKHNDEFKRKNALGDAYIKECEELYDKRTNKKITLKEFNKEMNAIAKKYNCYKYSSDVNAVHFETAFCGPNSNREYFLELKGWFEKWKENPNVEIVCESERHTDHMKHDIDVAIAFYNNYINGIENGWQGL